MNNISSLPAALLASGPIRIDGVTYYMHAGKPRACKSKRESRTSRTEGEKQVTNRFTEVRKMWRIYHRAIGTLEMWRIMAREMGGGKSDSLFHSTNGGCFRPGKGVWAFKTFRFSVGTLDAPMITGGRRDGRTVTLEWENDVDCPKASASDQDFVGFFYETMPRSPAMVNGITALRGDGRVVADIPACGQPEGTPLHLYLFFGSKDLDHFSPSEYVGV